MAKILYTCAFFFNSDAIHAHTKHTYKMSFATSSFAGVQVSKAVAAPKASGRSAVLRVEARRTKASAPSRSAAKVRYVNSYFLFFFLFLLVGDRSSGKKPKKNAEGRGSEGEKGMRAGYAFTEGRRLSCVVDKKHSIACFRISFLRSD